MAVIDGLFAKVGVERVSEIHLSSRKRVVGSDFSAALQSSTHSLHGSMSENFLHVRHIEKPETSRIVVGLRQRVARHTCGVCEDRRCLIASAHVAWYMPKSNDGRKNVRNSLLSFL